MKYLFLIPVALLTATLISCGGAETKADPSADTDTNTERSGADKIPETSPAPAARADSSAMKSGHNEILAHIDQYLISTTAYPADGASAHATVTVKNTLSNITFQKAIIEIDIIAADGKLLKNDFYPIQNIEPGDMETIKLSGIAKGASIKSHVVKVKSNELTNGETVIVGALYEPGK